MARCRGAGHAMTATRRDMPVVVWCVKLSGRALHAQEVESV